MAKRSTLLLQHISSFILLPSLVQASLWTVDIDNGPAPSPEDGPPLSAHATRDSHLLAGQICGIIGAYVATVLILGSLLVTIGRRMRRAALSAYLSVSTEMVRPTINQFDDSPISPRSQRSWYSPRRLKNKRSMQGSTRTVSNPGSPAVQSIASFDPGVIESDRVARQQELEQLYAAAFAQEAAKSRTTIAEDELSQVGRTASKSRRQPPRLLTSAPALAHLHLQDSQISPVSPRSPVRAIYPPRSPRFQPASPISPMRPDYGQPKSSELRGPASPAAASTRTRTSSFGSQIEGKRPRKGLRNLRIQHRHYPSEVSDEEVRTPLTPRYYTDSGIPPSPPPKSEAATTPGTHDGYGTPVDIRDFDEIRAMPRPEPQRTGSHQYEVYKVGGGTSRQMELRLDTATAGGYGINHRAPSSNMSVSTLGTLPFRAMAQLDGLPLPSLGLVTKTTYLERRRDLLSAPRTGMATPYSPYMPFTPLTPVTPHLTSRAERKQREIDQGRRAPAAEDQVIDEEEMWGSDKQKNEHKTQETMWFPSLVQILYLLFLGAQVYGLFLHFLNPSTGLVNSTRNLQIKSLSFLAFLISFPSIFATSLPTAASHSTNTGLLHLLSWVFLAGSTALYAWCCEITGQGHLSVIFGKVTPKEVINTGPYALVRHPVYVSYILGWLGSLIAMQQEWRHNHALFGFIRMVGMGVTIMGLVGLYREGAELEERQFMLNEDVVKGETVELGVRRKYESYKSVVGARWIPGII
ncbi:hypothetical protein E4T42_07984 [Aureobasidium subglaciale]|nr:hypothetical protein E4T42_07984 [Aureobasidium subglaciale]